MPLFACRWPNSDVSFVMAPTKRRAIERLDEVGNAEGCLVLRVPGFQVHLKLTDDGEFEFEKFGEVTYSSILRSLYPRLDQVWGAIGEEQYSSDNPTITPDQQARIRRAVIEERERVEPKQVAEPQTQFGKDIKQDLDMPTSLVNKIVDERTREQLKSFRPRGKKH